MSDRPLVRILGPITIGRSSDEEVAPARLDRVVLAHLALAEGRGVPSDDLLEAVWGPAPPDGARNALQVKVSRLRRHLGADAAALQYRQGSYLLDMPDDQVDAQLFSALTRTAANAIADRRPADAVAVAARARRLWRGAPLADLDEHPRLVAARARLLEQHAQLDEVAAEAALTTVAGADDAIAVLRGLLAADPLRPRARLLLMRALEHTGRRAEALAVYDVGRRLLAEQTGLAPAAALQEEYERLLAAERAAVRGRRPELREPTVPDGAVETARWLLREGATNAALELALRGSWWWWLGGRRTEARALFEDLTGISDTGGSPATPSATAWLSVFDAASADAELAISTGEVALRDALEHGWGRHDSVAAVLLAERLLQRGEPKRGLMLLQASRHQLSRTHDTWGLALVGLTEAKAELQRGSVTAAATGARAARETFAGLEDAAGQMMAMDLLGYCAEIVGDLTAAARTHQQALTLARDVKAPEWQATQLTRLGSVQALLGDERGVTTLLAAVRLATAIGSPAAVALAENGLGLARGLSGDHDRAAEIHTTTLEWYERQGSRAGVSYTAGRLALERAATDAEDAAQLASYSVDLAGRTGDPRAIAYGLEAVALAHDDAPTQARALGGAWALRQATRSPLPTLVAAPVGALHDRLADRLGTDLPRLLDEGAQQARDLAGPGTSA